MSILLLDMIITHVGFSLSFPKIRKPLYLFRQVQDLYVITSRRRCRKLEVAQPIGNSSCHQLGIDESLFLQPQEIRVLSKWNMNVLSSKYWKLDEHILVFLNRAHNRHKKTC